jgi:8-amino-7-oxononanoate synthase
MPPALAQASCNSLSLIESFDPQRAHLAALIDRFHDQVTGMGYHLMPSATPIQPIIVGSNEAALALSGELQSRGLLVTAIRPPTVPEGQARLRITLSAAHSFDDLERLLQALAQCRAECVAGAGLGESFVAGRARCYGNGSDESAVG